MFEASDQEGCAVCGGCGDEVVVLGNETSGCLFGWMGGWVFVWVDGWVCVCLGGWVGVCLGGWVGV